MIDEPAFTSTRTDADSYADHALSVIPGIGRIDERRRGYIRDELAEAFLSGEHQGECRAIIVISIARENTTDPAVRAALGDCLQILGAIDV